MARVRTAHVAQVERLKSADIVKLAVILAAGVATAVYGFLFSQVAPSPPAAPHAARRPAQSRAPPRPPDPPPQAVDWTVRATLLGLLALRGFQTWRSVVAAKGLMDDFIRTTLYHRSQVVSSESSHHLPSEAAVQSTTFPVRQPPSYDGRTPRRACYST